MGEPVPFIPERFPMRPTSNQQFDRECKMLFGKITMSRTLSMALAGTFVAGGVLLPSTEAEAQSAATADEPTTARLKIRCVSDGDAALPVVGRLASFVWERGDNSIKIVRNLPLRCDGADVVDAITVKVPARATHFQYKVVAKVDDPLADTPQRTVCRGDVNFRNSPEPMTPGELPGYAVVCKIQNGNKAVFQLIPR